MNKLKWLNSFSNRITGSHICLLSLVLLPTFFLIPMNDILASIAKTNIVQQLYIPVKVPLLTLECIVCCLAVFLCWSITEVHRQKSNKCYERILTIADETQKSNAQILRDSNVIRKSIKLTEQTVEDYAMLLLMMNKQPIKNANQPEDTEGVVGIQEASLELKKSCTALAE